ncbi:unnamed protein product [Moneuplotes crassus]|uniref:RBR-type E3 ubiquitin transferase n=1 Tax=Euplotes crassus TaxID=5936 RepID=A0AAD1Y198_EUPCR|nr:unnamed protein product [Moneuplotes crassus]
MKNSVQACCPIEAIQMVACISCNHMLYGLVSKQDFISKICTSFPKLLRKSLISHYLLESLKASITVINSLLEAAQAQELDVEEKSLLYFSKLMYQKHSQESLAREESKIEEYKIEAESRLEDSNFPFLNKENCQHIEGDESYLQDISRNEESKAYEDECKICLMGIESEKAYCISQCGHSFHQDCILMHLTTSIDQSKIPIKCPIEDCELDLGMDTFKDLLDESYLKRFELFSLKLCIQKEGNFLNCPNKDCEYVFCLEKEDHRGYFQCPMCFEEYCIGCDTKWHPEFSCEKNQEINGNEPLEANDQKAIDYALKENMKRCPACKFWVSKIEGCNAMTCRCGASFCYHCGEQSEDAHKCQCEGGYGRRNRSFERPISDSEEDKYEESEEERFRAFNDTRIDFSPFREMDMGKMYAGMQNPPRFNPYGETYENESL